ncbi:histidine phosphatase family protein [Aromatoleum toluvorans]|uniref:Histidine phosphatase family protein n=1 Tax=Aromatoleum toluvorans TaxID=92002 RepID=A0ABX1Q4J5_9RHOO|nr:histidine phosphatase family protein [Aromatoleum toluvorans]NMG45276.1 histidine phosphatase family protein [Aromatoleum toluvorans]
MSVLTLMRHGQASFGEARYDTLSPLGRQQAQATGRWLRECGDPVTDIRHGPRSRQTDTAGLVCEAAAFGRAPERTPGLDEFAEGEEVLAAAAVLFGRPMSGAEAPARAEQLRCYDAAYEAWSHGKLDIPGRAGFVEFRRNVTQWLRATVAAPDAPSGESILAVTSGGVIAAVVCDLLGLPDGQWCPLVRQVRNGSLTEIVFSRGRVSLRSFNGVGHLPRGLRTSI